jgi:hypothetical protein
VASTHCIVLAGYRCHHRTRCHSIHGPSPLPHVTPLQRQWQRLLSLFPAAALELCLHPAQRALRCSCGCGWRCSTSVGHATQCPTQQHQASSRPHPHPQRSRGWRRGQVHGTRQGVRTLPLPRTVARASCNHRTQRHVRPATVAHSGTCVLPPPISCRPRRMPWVTPGAARRGAPGQCQGQNSTRSPRAPVLTAHGRLLACCLGRAWLLLRPQAADAPAGAALLGPPHTPCLQAILHDPNDVQSATAHTAAHHLGCDPLGDSC